tara:strand:- start:353 stop:484 length:132 start_codon:yes stop_codon:yes gene_type:complete
MRLRSLEAYQLLIKGGCTHEEAMSLCKIMIEHEVVKHFLEGEE